MMTRFFGRKTEIEGSRNLMGKKVPVLSYLKEDVELANRGLQKNLPKTLTPIMYSQASHPVKPRQVKIKRMSFYVS